MVQPRSAILIAGTGAMASLFAARLAASGNAVMILGAWPEALQALRRAGVRLVEPDGAEQAYPVQVFEDPVGLPPVHRALVLVKSWQTARAAEQLAACLAPDGLALTLQNGLGNRETLAEILGEARVALGVTTVGASLVAPGRVRPAGEGMISLSRRQGLEALAEALRAAGFPLEYAADPDSLLWGKLAINAAINPLAALLGVSNGRLLEDAHIRALMATSVGEVSAVAQALGIALPYADPAAAVEAVARRTAANYASMLQDIRRGAPTEIDAISGAVVRAGSQAGVPTPVNRVLWQLVKAKVALGALPGSHNETHP